LSAAAWDVLSEFTIAAPFSDRKFAAPYAVRWIDDNAVNIERTRGAIPVTKLEQVRVRCLTATDFLSVEVYTLKGLVTHYVLFFIDIASRRSVHIAGITPIDGRGRSRGTSPMSKMVSFEAHGI